MPPSPPKETRYGLTPPWQVEIDGQQTPVEIVRAKVRPPGCPVWVEWTWLGYDDEAVALKGLLAGTDADAKRALQGRPIVQEVRRRVGRTTGWRTQPTDEFERRLRSELTYARRDTARFTQPAMARRIGLSVTTFKRYLSDMGITWREVQSGEWPPPD